ncbi:OmpA family protein [Tateyamaria sp.]|uniref:OmpA family protein n=1 Tax=Tateyamaria sp. TaxID=1929288 RepID=UPI003B213616
MEQELATAASEYGAFEPAYLYVTTAVTTIAAITQIVFPKVLFPAVPGRAAILRVIGVLVLFALLAVNVINLFWPREALVLVTYYLIAICAAAVALVLYLLFRSLWAKNLVGRGGADVVAIVGPSMRPDVRKRFNEANRDPTKILQGADYDVTAIWPAWSRYTGYVALFATSAVAQVCGVVSVLMVAMILADPPVVEVVDETGAAKVRTIPAQFVFEVDKATLADPTVGQMQGELAEIQAFSPQLVIVRGHTDTSGDAAYNRDLSQRRADAVAAWLAAQPLLSEIEIRAQGMGEDCLRFSENGLQGEGLARAQQNNRRVELVLLQSVDAADDVQSQCNPA